MSEIDTKHPKMNGNDRPDIIFIVLDTCRASTFNYLRSQNKIPHIEDVLSEGVYYEGATAPAPWTVPSHASFFTGEYPTVHGTTASSPHFEPPSSTLAEELNECGYFTAGISANVWVSPSFNFDIGFDRFKSAEDLLWSGKDLSDIRKMNSRRKQLVALIDKLDIESGVATAANAIHEQFIGLREDDGAQRITSDAIELLEARSQSEQPTFLFLNYLEPHLEYDPPRDLAIDELPDDVTYDQALEVNQDPWGFIAGEEEMDAKDFEILRALYRAEIRYVDSQLGRLFDTLGTSGESDSPCVVILGDHGENIGEHGLMDHQYCLYETLLHVPLAISYPKDIDSSSVTTPVETRRVYQTILDVAGVAKQDSESLLNTHNASNHVIAQYPDPQPSMDSLEDRVSGLGKDVIQYDRALRSIRTGKWKFIEGSDGQSELYNLNDDPAELNPINNDDKKSELQNILTSKFGGRIRLDDGEYNIDSKTQDRLEDLGYI